MPDFTAKRVDEMEGLYGGAMRKVRAELGLSSMIGGVPGSAYSAPDFTELGAPDPAAS